MKPLIFAFICLLFSYNPVHGQATNNDFEYDKEDFEFIFSKLGFDAMKFPIKQQQSEILDVVIEEYRGGVLSSKKTAIGITNETFKDYGIDATSYATPKLKEGQFDSVFLHRIYAENGDSLLTVHVITQGITVPIKFDIHDLSTANIRAVYETKEDLDNKAYLEIEEKRPLAYFYANKDPNLPLFCPAGMAKDKVIESFYYAVFISIEPYFKE